LPSEILISVVGSASLLSELEGQATRALTGNPGLRKILSLSLREILASFEAW
jgi:hypothetical protein